MLTQFASLGVWDWFIAGGLLFVLEVLAPGVAGSVDVSVSGLPYLPSTVGRAVFGVFKSGLYHLARRFPQLPLVPIYLDNLAALVHLSPGAFSRFSRKCNPASASSSTRFANSWADSRSCLILVGPAGFEPAT